MRPRFRPRQRGFFASSRGCRLCYVPASPWLGGAAGFPDGSKPPRPLQFWHLPLPWGKQDVQCFPFCSASRPVPWQTWQIPVPLQCGHFLYSSIAAPTLPSRPELISGTRDNNRNSYSPGAGAGFRHHNADTSCLRAGRRGGNAGYRPAHRQRP